MFCTSRRATCTRVQSLHETTGRWPRLALCCRGDDIFLDREYLERVDTHGETIAADTHNVEFMVSMTSLASIVDVSKDIPFVRMLHIATCTHDILASCMGPPNPV